MNVNDPNNKDICFIALKEIPKMSDYTCHDAEGERETDTPSKSRTPSAALPPSNLPKISQKSRKLLKQEFTKLCLNTDRSLPSYKNTTKYEANRTTIGATKINEYNLSTNRMYPVNYLQQLKYATQTEVQRASERLPNKFVTQSAHWRHVPRTKLKANDIADDPETRYCLRDSQQIQNNLLKDTQIHEN